jgi:hypothetical protein
MPTSMPYETGRGFAPEKFERTPFNTHGVNAQGNYSSNASQAHSDMSLLEKYFHEAEAAKHTSYAGSHVAMSEGPGQSGSVHSGSSVNMSRKTMSTSSVTDRLRSVHPTQDLGGSFSIPATQRVGSSRGKAQSSIPSTRVDGSMVPRVIETPLQKAVGKRPMRPSSEAGSYMSGHVSNSSGSVNPNAIVPRASGQRSYGSIYDIPGGMAGKFARVTKEVFLEAQRQKDMRDYFNAHKPGFRLAKRRLFITGATNPDQIPDRVV